MHTTTLKKISGILDLSISTVSRALKNHPDISEKTKQKVLDLAKTLEYEPNAYAVHLRTNNSKVFGLMVPSVSLYFYHSFISSVEEEARKNGYSVIILQSGDDPVTELNNLKLCRQNRVSGLFACITPHTNDITPFLKLNELDIPVIFFDKVPSLESCNKICVADANAAGIAANALISNNKQTVLSIFGDIHFSITKRRLQAYKDVFKTNAPLTRLLIHHALNAGEAFTITHQYLSTGNLSASIFCMSDEILTGSMKAIQQLQLKIPEDVSVIAISNGFLPHLYFPQVTYVETSGYKLGKLAFSYMLSCLAGESSNQELIVEAILVTGGSL